jgi:hypothetical protein
MNYIHSFHEFEKLVENRQHENLDEGFKENIFAGLLSLFAAYPLSSQVIKNVVDRAPDSTVVTKTVNFKLDDKMTKDKADAIVKRMLSHGFNITSEKIDTVWKKTKETQPDTGISILSMKFDKDSSFFASGKFDLSASAKRDIEKAFEKVIAQDGLVTNVTVTSSTDKQKLSSDLQKKLASMNYKGDNSGLSQARADEVKSYLTEEIGLEDSLVKVVNLVEGGVGEIDASARYVKVDITYMCCSYVPVEDEKEKTVNYTVVMRKTTKNLPQPKITSFEEAKEKTFDMGKIADHNSPSSVKCPKW